LPFVDKQNAHVVVVTKSSLHTAEVTIIGAFSSLYWVNQK